MLLAAYLSRNLERFKKLFRELDEKGRLEAILFRVDDGSINFLEKILMDQRSEEFVLFLSSFQNKVSAAYYSCYFELLILNEILVHQHCKFGSK